MEPSRIVLLMNGVLYSVTLVSSHDIVRNFCLRARLDINGMDGFVRWQGSVRFAQLWGVWNGRQAPFLK
jgi:hypothetical protein